MSNRPKFWGIHADPPNNLRWVLAAVPFAALIVLYLFASHFRLAENPDDKLLPSPKSLFDAIYRMAFTPDKRSGEYLMWVDTVSSLRRLAIGVGCAATAGLLLGLNKGLFPGMSALVTAFVTFISIIPPLALLPILFITFGVDELAKVMLIFIGTFPTLARDMYGTVKAMPKELTTKALTLGASQLQLTYRIVMPQLLPRLIDGIRLSLGSAWLFLIAAEAIASSDGLGYRIFLVRRYLAMDVIIPYVLWITLLGFLFDWVLQQVVSRLYPWYRA